MTMTAPELLTKRCRRCGEVKPASEFYRHSSRKDGLDSRCKPCAIAVVNENKARLREEMGEDYYLEHQRQIVQRHRRRTGDKAGRAYRKARTQATRVLIDRHRDEFEHLLLLARRGEL